MEVLVVIGIIAVLTAIIYPSLSDIKKKNRDTERVSDIAAIQLGLSLYKSQKPQNVYPEYIYNSGTANPNFSPKYVPADSLIGPDGQPYTYVPLARGTNSDKCTYYHLGNTLELGNAQIDTADTFNTYNLGNGANTEGYSYCTAGSGYSGSGLAPGGNNYNVHP